MTATPQCVAEAGLDPLAARAVEHVWMHFTRYVRLWMHKADDPRCYVGDVVEATEADDGLAIKGPV